MNPELKLTADGSHTLYAVDIDETYHSTFGAVQESLHVFIENGLKYADKTDLCVFEAGFGTGLNAFLTLQAAKRYNLSIHYVTVEKFPLGESVYEKLNYAQLVWPGNENVFRQLHECKWNEPVKISDNFILEKIEIDLKQYIHRHNYNIIYFDAFSPEKQPELWSEDIFRHIFDSCEAGAVLTTYCAKGAVRRALKTAGFATERLPGPPGKREILRAVKLIS